MFVQQRLPYNSLGYWLKRIHRGDALPYVKGELEKSLSKHLPLILADFPLPLALVAPIIHPKTEQSCMQIVYGGDFFEALYQFYMSKLCVYPENLHWISEYDTPLPNKLTWDTASDRTREKIFNTGIYVTELLSTEERYFSSAQIEQLSKIDFGF